MNQSTSVIKSNPKTTPISKIILILASISLAIVIIEVAGYLFPNSIPELIRVYFQGSNIQSLELLAGDKDLGFKYAPELADYPAFFYDDEGGTGFYTVSTVSLGYESIGFRDDGIEGEIFAVVVGDSFTACTGVEMEECWVEILERESGKDYANLGVACYGPQQTQRMLTKYGLPLEPKLVLWVFYANDPYEAWYFNQFGVAEAKEGKLWKSPAQAWLVQHSTTYMILMYFWYNRFVYYNLAIADGGIISPKYNLVWWQTITDLTTPAIIEGSNLTYTAILEAKQQTLTRFKEAKFVVVIIPAREQVYYTDAILQSHLNALVANLVDFARQNDISVINLTPSIKERVKDEPYIYFKQDMHLNPRGNEIIAELLEQNLEIILAGGQNGF